MKATFAIAGLAIALGAFSSTGAAACPGDGKKPSLSVAVADPLCPGDKKPSFSCPGDKKPSFSCPGDKKPSQG